MAEYWNADILVLGCGNVLFGDDGFGPAVADYLHDRGDLPPGTSVINAGLSVRDVLFTIALGERRPRVIILVDAVDASRRPGEVFERDVREIVACKVRDSSMHLHPTSHLLRELHDTCGVAVRIVSVQVHHIPDEVAPGLSDVVRCAVPTAGEKILDLVRSQAA